MEYFVHCRETHNITSEFERQVEVEYEAMARGYKLRYEVVNNRAYNFYVEVESDLEFLAFKLRCG
jgi:hypothetical protein